MGEWRVGDECIVLGDKAIVYGAVPATSRPGRRIYIKFLGGDDPFIAQDFEDDADKHYLRIPRTIDDSSEESRGRDLVGMLNQKGKEWLWKRYNMEELPFSNKFTEAILRALIAQWEVEI